jgi:hypothetical protein
MPVKSALFSVSGSSRILRAPRCFLRHNPPLGGSDPIEWVAREKRLAILVPKVNHSSLIDLSEFVSMNQARGEFTGCLPLRTYAEPGL